MMLLLIWLPQLVFSQEKNLLSRLKAAEWFEVSVKIQENVAKVASGDPDLKRYDLKYKLKNQHPDGSRTYDLIVERTRIKCFYPGSIMGYDSYYPAYLQSNNETSVKPAFELKIGKSGEIVSVKAGNKFTRPMMSPVQVQKAVNGIILSAVKPIDAELIKQISELIIRNTPHNTEFFWQLTAASFPIQKNTLIKGKINNMNDSVRERLILYATGKGEVVFEKDGTFNMPMLLDEGCDVNLLYQIEPKSLNVSFFIEPGDTLVMNADGQDLEKSIRFSGNSARMAELAMELNKVKSKFTTPELEDDVKEFSASSFMSQQVKDKALFDQVMSKYKGQISKNGWDYYYFQFVYRQADAKTDFLLKTKYRSSPQAKEVFEDFPKDFFKSIDTLPIQMNEYRTNEWYTTFIHDFGLYLGDKVGRVSGGQYGFLSSYAMSLTYLKHFPLYFSLSEAFEQELEESNWKKAQLLKPYYEDFIRNCGDTSLTNHLKLKWKRINAWAPGKESPLKSIKLADGSVLDLSKFKGKTLSLTFNFHYPEEVKHLLERIKKQDPSKVQFVIVQLEEENYPKSRIDTAFRKFPNVTYVKISFNDQELEEKLMMSHFDIKTFLFDRDFKVVEDNIDEQQGGMSEKNFEEAVKKALTPKQMDKEQKAALIKTIGWSAGSILFTFLFIFFINKGRIAGIRKKEALKRQIKELELKAIRSQMNPHFLFNSMNSIQSLINGKQYLQANIYLEKFSLLMRRVLNNSEASFVTLSDELEAIKLYCELEQLRFDFKFEINISPDVNTQLTEIPGMIIQPLVENSVLHGLAQKGAEGELVISINYQQPYLKIIVTDNGSGLKEKASTHHQSFGLKLVRERLNLLNTGGIAGDLELSSNLGTNQSGVTAILTIPID